MITFTEKTDLGPYLVSIMYAVQCALDEVNDRRRQWGEEEDCLCIDDLSDYQLGIECMASCGYPESDLSYNNIIDQMEKLGFGFDDFDCEFDRERYNRNFGSWALEMLGKTARQEYQVYNESIK